MTNNVSKKRYVPSSFLVIFGLMILFIIISWIGQAATDTINGIGILDAFTSIWHGFVGKASIILFIFAIGGTLGVMTKINAIDAGIDALVRKLGDKTLILIPILMLLFGLGGTTYGMWEETVAFIPVLIPVFKKAGYGPFTAVLVILVGAGTGCLASTVNPFSTGAAVSAVSTLGADADAQALMGTVGDKDATEAALTTAANGSFQGIRWLSFALFEILGIGLVMWQATRYKAKKDVVTGLNEKLIEERFAEKEGFEFTLKRKLSLGLFILGFLIMIILYLPWGNWFDSLGATNDSYNKSMWWFASGQVDSEWSNGSAVGFGPIGDWYFISVAALFTMITFIIFAINFNDFKSKDENQEEGFISSYMGGIKDMVSVCMLIAMAGGLGNILSTTNIGPEIARSIAGAHMGMIAFGVATFFLSIVLSLLVPSTSGFAGAFMPIFAQVAISSGLGMDGVGLAILAFLFANGLANFVTPTSAALMGYTALAGVPYPVWIKQTWKITLSMFVASLLLIVVFGAMANGGSAF